MSESSGYSEESYRGSGSFKMKRKGRSSLKNIKNKTRKPVCLKSVYQIEQPNEED